MPRNFLFDHRLSLRESCVFFVAVFFSSTSIPAFAQNDLTDIPAPNPVEERQSMRVDPACEVNLFASDPDIRKPVQVNFDSSGGLWVASSETYPQIKPGEKASDQLVVLRDLDGDGIAESSTVFADGLLIPTGVVPDGPHAAYVADSTQLLYLEDTDHDGKADKRRVVLSGFGTEDTHHLVHTLRWGPDGCLYFNQSIYIHSHIDTPDGTRRLDGGGIWRYRPHTGQLDIMCKGFINPWGHVFDENGESFVTDGAFFEGINHAFPDSVFVTSPGATRWLSGMNPGSPKHCGLEVLSGTHIPSDWNGDLVTNDFRSHRVCRFSIRSNGASYLSRQQPELIVSDHVAFRPIGVRMGPDGSVYVADWYNPIIQHGEVDFRDPRRDTKHGRIWRISFPGREPDPWPDFNDSSAEQLLGLLHDPSLSVRQFARQELWPALRDTKTKSKVLEQASQWAATSSSPEERSTRELELQWLREVADQAPDKAANEAWSRSIVGITDDASVAATGRPALRSRFRQAMQAAVLNASDAQSHQLAASELVHSLVDVNDLSLLIEVIVCNGQLATPQAALDLHRILARLPDIVSHPTVDFAMWRSLKQTQRHWMNSDSVEPEAAIHQTLSDLWKEHPSVLAFAVKSVQSPTATQLIIDRLFDDTWSPEKIEQILATVGEVASPQQLGELLSLILESDPTKGGKSVDPTLSSDNRERWLQAILTSSASRRDFIPKNANASFQKFTSEDQAASVPESWLPVLAAATKQWKLSSTEEPLFKALSKATEGSRGQIIDALASMNTPSASKLVDELSKSDSVEDRRSALNGLVRYRPGAAINHVVGELTSETPDPQAFDWLIAALPKKNLLQLYVKRLEKVPLSTDVARTLLRRVRSAGGNEQLEAVIRKSGQLADASWKLTPEFSTRILSSAKQNGSAERGEAIYRRKELQCIVCHGIGPGGGVVGPNLVSLGGSSQPDYILQSLIDPSAKLKEGYSTRKLLTEDGEVINGIVIGETKELIRLRLADGKTREIATESIADDVPGKSLMPEGMLDDLTEAELVDLVAFMSALGKERDYTVSTEQLVRQYETLLYTNEANRRLNRTSTDTAASDDPLLSWRPLTTLVNGRTPISELDRFQQHRQTPPTSFVRFRFQITPIEQGAETAPAGIQIHSGQASQSAPEPEAWNGIEAWLDGRPLPTWKLGTKPLSIGEHTVVLSVNRDVVKSPFAIELGKNATP